MSRRVDLERVRVEKLAKELLPTLRDHGELLAETGALESVERWRRAARRAARSLGWSIRTGVTRDGKYVWAGSDDWPVPPGYERRVAGILSNLLAGRRP